MTKTVAESICDTIGLVCQSTGSADKEGGSFMQVYSGCFPAFMSRSCGDFGEWEQGLG